MNCPVCKRDHANTLSICPSCGAMIHDSVREDLTLKITPLIRAIPKPENIDLRGNLQVKNTPISKASVNQPSVALINNEPKKIELNLNPEIKFEAQKLEIIQENSETSELDTKNTNPTLVEFHNKNAQLPEWRLELKNLVRKRNNKVYGISETEPVNKNIEIADSPNVRRKNLITSGANALKVEEVAEPLIQNISNPKLAAALARIEKSRSKFLEVEKPAEQNFEMLEKRNNTLLYFTAKPNDHLPKTAISTNYANFEEKPKVAVSLKASDGRLNTNKLPPLPKPAKISTSFNQRPLISEVIETNFVHKQFERQETIEQEIIEVSDFIEVTESIEIESAETQEIDDCAPFAMRFNAGLFDLIIGSFAGVLLLAPFMAMGGEWLTISGLLALLATVSVVMFIYMTIAIGLYAKTFGMKLFSLEVVDIGGDLYPTVHQAAVSSCVYLLTLAFGGIGFLTFLFNDEKRAAHDLVSHTIVVKEF